MPAANPNSARKPLKDSCRSRFSAGSAVMRMLGFMLLAITAGISGCGTSSHSSPSVSSAAAVNLPFASQTSVSSSTLHDNPPQPTSITITYAPVQLEELPRGSFHTEEGERRILPITESLGSPLTLEMRSQAPAKEGDLPIRTASLQFRGHMFPLPDEVSSDAWEASTFTDTGPLYRNDRACIRDHASLSLIGGIELFSNGPGRYLYFLYDQVHDRWETFQNWGTPVCTDLDQDGVSDWMIRFDGLHLQGPDVTLYRWREGELEASPQLTSLLQSEFVSYTPDPLPLFTAGHLRGDEPVRSYILRQGILLPQK